VQRHGVILLYIVQFFCFFSKDEIIWGLLLLLGPRNSIYVLESFA
jgi:hypothetical protein